MSRSFRRGTFVRSRKASSSWPALSTRIMEWVRAQSTPSTCISCFPCFCFLNTVQSEMIFFSFFARRPSMLLLYQDHYWNVVCATKHKVQLTWISRRKKSEKQRRRGQVIFSPQRAWLSLRIWCEAWEFIRRKIFLCNLLFGREIYGSLSGASLVKLFSLLLRALLPKSETTKAPRQSIYGDGQRPPKSN